MLAGFATFAHPTTSGFTSSDTMISVASTSASHITHPTEEHPNTAELVHQSSRAEHCKIYTNGFLESWRLVGLGGSLEAEGKGDLYYTNCVIIAECSDRPDFRRI